MSEGGDNGGYEDRLGINDQRDTSIQIGLSLILGVGAFLAFCVCSMASLTSARRLTQFHDSIFVLDGPVYMLLERSRKVKPMLYQSYQTHTLDGYLRYGRSQNSKSLHQQALMPMS